MPAPKGRDAFYRIAPFALFIAFLAAESFVAMPGLAVIRGLMVAVLLAAFWRHYSELKVGKIGDRPRLSDSDNRGLSPIFLSLASGLLVFFLWIHLDANWMIVGEMGKGYAPLAADGSIDWARAALRLFGLALVVPVMEELFWRSFLMRWIDKRDFLAMDPRRASVMAVALSSGLFAIEHTQWLAGLVAGIIYSWLYRRTGNLWVPIASHAITNTTLGVWIVATRNWQYW